jgi:hypothetical protein
MPDLALGWSRIFPTGVGNFLLLLLLRLLSSTKALKKQQHQQLFSAHACARGAKNWHLAGAGERSLISAPGERLSPGDHKVFDYSLINQRNQKGVLDRS